MEKQGFHRWAWLVVFLLGGLLMLYGGAQDVTLFFSPEGDLAPVPSWHPVPPLVGLLCGLIVLASAGLNVVWGWQLRRAEDAQERRLARRVALVSTVAMIADWVSGYYGFGSLMALLVGLWLMMKHTPTGK
jgi:type IV secretory pathway VirB2 component (pilin)